MFTAVIPCPFFVEPSTKCGDYDRVVYHLYIVLLLFFGNFEHILYSASIVAFEQTIVC